MESIKYRAQLDQLKNIPKEMCLRSQWVLWKYENRHGKDTKVLFDPKTHRNASINKSWEWSDIKTAWKVFSNNIDYYNGLGFVLTEQDPYALIDLDTPENEIQVNLQGDILQHFKSYREISPSYQGRHIICKGDLCQGIHKNSIGMFSSRRFIVMTGLVEGESVEIYDENRKLNKLFDYVNKLVTAPGIVGSSRKSSTKILPELPESYPQTMTDEMVYNYCCGGKDGYTFFELWCGRWENLTNEYGRKRYETHSEADLAFFNYVCAITKNIDQIVRLFKMSDLVRDKTSTDYQLDRLLRISLYGSAPLQVAELVSGGLIFAPQKNVENETITGEIIYENETDYSNLNKRENRSVSTNTSKEIITMKQREVYESYENNTPWDTIEYPMGIMYDICKVSENMSNSPVKITGIVASLMTIASICSRQYQVAGSGLNLYLCLCGQSGIGKSVPKVAMDILSSNVKKYNKNFAGFCGKDPGSEQGLRKDIGNSSTKSYLCTIGEFGDALPFWYPKHKVSTQPGLLKVILNIYQSSGKGNLFSGISYSDSEKNTGDIVSPALNIYAEGNPQKIFNYLEPEMTTDGLLSRFCFIDYKGKVAKTNKNKNYTIPESLAKKLYTLTQSVQNLHDTNVFVDIQSTVEAAQMIEDYRDLEVVILNGDVPEYLNAPLILNNRMALKTHKIAGLHAISRCFPNPPLIDVEDVVWARNFVEMENRDIRSRFEKDEVGNARLSESTRVSEVESAIQSYFNLPDSALSKFMSTPTLRNAGLITRSYLSNILSKKECFKFEYTHQHFPSMLNSTLLHMAGNGQILILDKRETSITYRCNAQLYAIPI